MNDIKIIEGGKLNYNFLEVQFYLHFFSVYALQVLCFQDESINIQ